MRETISLKRGALLFGKLQQKPVCHFLGDKARQIFEKLGVDYSPTSGMLASMLLPENALLVLDDFERVGNIAELELFGVVSELMENRRQRVLLVVGSEGREHESAILEKLVWRTFVLDFDCSAMVDRLFGDVLDECNDLCAKPILISGIEKSGSRNIRVLMRSAPVIETIIRFDLLSNIEMSNFSRTETISDLVEYVIRAQCDTLPKKPEEVTKDSTLSDQIYFNRSEAIWKKSKALSIVGEIADNASELEIEKINEALLRYCNKYYPSSEREKNALLRSDCVKYAIMTDDEAQDSAKAITDALEAGDVCIDNIPTFIRALFMLKEWGFVTNEHWDQSVDGAVGVIMADPTNALKSIRLRGTDWRDESAIYGLDVPELDNLADLVEREVPKWYIKRASAILLDSKSHDVDGLTEALAGVFKSVPLSLVQLDATKVAGFVSKGSPRQISQFRGWILDIAKGSMSDGDAAKVCLWLERMKRAFVESLTERSSKMGKVQIDYAVENLADAIVKLKQ